MDVHFLPRRLLGGTGFVATRLGAGDLADRGIPFEVGVATLRRALDAGLNVVDTAPSYEEGLSERIVGAALAGRRGDAFLIDKVDHPDDPVAPQVSASLGRLGLRETDAFVFHGVSDLATWRRLAARGGGLGQLAEEIRAGRTRFRGISSHHPDVLREAIPSGLVDLVMFPLGPFVDSRYEREILPLARRCEVGTIAFKTFGAGKLLADTEGYQRPLAGRPGSPASRDLPHLTVEECLHYTLTLDPDVALLGLSTPQEQDAAFAAAASFRAPLAPDALAETRRRAARALEGKGDVWWNPTRP